MIYLFDTDVCMCYLCGMNSANIEIRLNVAQPGDVVYCALW